MRDGYQTYETGQPWVCYGYPIRDDEIPAEGGESRVDMRCCICGERGVAVLRVPPLGAPAPALGYKHPDRAARNATHEHPLQRTAPETWALPLLNPAAHGDLLMILQDVAEKARAERDAMRRADREDYTPPRAGGPEADHGE